MSRRTPDRNWSGEYISLRPFTEAGRGAGPFNPLLVKEGVRGTKVPGVNRCGAEEARKAHNLEDT